LLGLPAVGCSLIIPLDYTGGIAGAGAGQTGFAGTLPVSLGGSSNQGGASGRSGQGGSGGQGGSVAGGGFGGTSGSGNGGPGGEEGMAANGGAAGAGGDDAGAGGESGEAGADGASGHAGMGGTAGFAGTSAGGNAMGGASAGISGGGSSGGGGCAGADLTTDEEHCGSCSNVCLPDAQCIAGVCINTPCEGLCAPAVEMPLVPNDGYREDDIGSAATCHQVSAYNPAPNLPSIIAWNFVDTRTLKVNGVAVAHEVEPGAPLGMPRRAGGYCIQAGAGDYDWAGYKLPLPSPLKP
jgi:hypothetical protein